VTGSRTVTSATRTPSSAVRVSAIPASDSAAISRNQPMEAGQSPPIAPPKMATSRPQPIRIWPKSRPSRAAVGVAAPKSSLRAHRSARSTRPPSSGSADKRLKTSRIRLIWPTQKTTPSTPVGSGMSSATARNETPSVSETSGPAIAIRCRRRRCGLAVSSSATHPLSKCAVDRRVTARLVGRLPATVQRPAAEDRPRAATMCLGADRVPPAGSRLTGLSA
jgi:hypothetical protein